MIWQTRTCAGGSPNDGLDLNRDSVFFLTLLAVFGCVLGCDGIYSARVAVRSGEQGQIRRVEENQMQSGAPGALPGAKVILTLALGSRMPRELEVTTDQNGLATAEFVGPPLGRTLVQITVSKPGYQSVEKNFRIKRGDHHFLATIVPDTDARPQE